MTDTLVTVVYTTRNRKDALMESIESVLAQEGVSMEVLVYDDASSDGTAEMVSDRFPQAQVFRSKNHEERLVLRNRGFQQARGQFVLSLDDDCYFCEKNTLKNALRFFDTPEVAVVALPFVEPFRNRSRDYFADVDLNDGVEIRSFVACAALLRKQSVNEVGGYREELVAHREEGELAARLIDRGYKLVYAGGDYLIHTTNPTRVISEATVAYVKNIILVPFLSYPVFKAIRHIVTGLVSVFTVSFRNRRLIDKLKGVEEGIRSCWKLRSLRRPVSIETYRKIRSLPSHGPWWFPPSQVVPPAAGRSL